MFYRSFEESGLPHDPFKAIVAPRPIGWISTLDANARPNLAPYSFFNIVSVRPHLIAFASHGFKHSIANASQTKEFVYNLVSLPLFESMLMTSEEVAGEVNEFDLAGIGMASCEIVSPPRVAAAPAALECKVVSILQLEDVDGRKLDRYLAIGQVVGVHIDDAALTDGIFDVAGIQPVARCGYFDYAHISDVYTRR